jgi:hypothetical protein
MSGKKSKGHSSGRTVARRPLTNNDTQQTRRDHKRWRAPVLKHAHEARRAAVSKRPGNTVAKPTT